MDYMTVRQAAEKWNLSPRSVQQLCTQGRIPGAGKFGKAWAIPADWTAPVCADSTKKPLSRKY